MPNHTHALSGLAVRLAEVSRHVCIAARENPDRARYELYLSLSELFSVARAIELVLEDLDEGRDREHLVKHP
jgi:hypothetical protein